MFYRAFSDPAFVKLFLVFWGICCGFGFVVGLIYGETFFGLPLKTWTMHRVSFENSPVWFLIIMAINLVVAFYVGWKLFRWFVNK